VEHQARFSTLNARFDDFLFAPVCEEANGMRLSVLSALARTNVDPWEEATRLAAMPKAIAEKTLLSILDLVSGRSWKSPEAAAIAARLVRLLPQAGEAAPAAAEIAKAPAQRGSYWWVWVGFALAMSFMMPHHEAATTNAGADTTQTGATNPAAGTTTPSESRAPDPIGQSR
jgi:thioredoxin-like negative regulator of GroEL